MASLLTVIPGSRRPIRVDSTGVVVNIAIQGSDHSLPQNTYRSPSLQFPSDLCIERSGQSIRASPSGLGPPPVPSTRSSHASPGAGVSANVLVAPANVKKKYPMKPPLPIYHPLGRLALSLPELEFGMRTQSPLSAADDATRNGSSRTRRPATKPREAADAEGMDTGTALAVPADAPATEKPSPRKRRSGGQTNSRRRRREPDDGDATYPAKRTRATRAPPVPPSEGGSPSNGGGDVADIDGSEEGMKSLERRSTRSRAAAQTKPPPVRRNSSASDRTQTSVSVSIAGSQPPRKEDVDVTPPGATVSCGEFKAGSAESPTPQIKAPDAQIPSTLKNEDTDEAREVSGAPVVPVIIDGSQKNREEGELIEEDGPR
ncbi:hypothetical protein B0F90DRAFT_1699539 [Multifurca ochricompacta]|uniref:Uncharacterized protein n=1 Tax=Multifurca ochricompacta TaxID=376703 RepID=A0AAD4QQQ9_9AGAM|nr:hypothetical protein B0F90DRAFT_1699539 [Multifurca ochricompacta]